MSSPNHRLRRVTGQPFAVVSLDNPNLVSRTRPFAWQDLRAPELDVLSERLNLTRYRDVSKGELTVFRALSSEVRGLAPHEDEGSKNVLESDAAPDAFSILDAIAEGRSLTCYFYALLLSQSLLALGHPTRIISSGKDLARDHATVEVWSRTFRKWVLLDPDSDATFLRDDVPQNAWELHDLYMVNHFDNRRETFRDGLKLSEHTVAPAPNFGGLELLRGSVVDSRINALLSHAPGGKHIDSFLLSYDGDFTNEPLELYPPVNVTQMAFHGGDAAHASVDVELRAFMLGFARFRVRVGEAEPMDLQARAFRWPLVEGDNELRAWAVNLRGVEGSVVSARVRVGGEAAK